MLIGAMNHPARDLFVELEWMAELGLDFIDLTLEPPRATAATVNLPALRAALARHDFSVVGHTAYYLPIGSPFESIRRAAVSELRQCLTAFAALGAKWMNIHPDPQAPMHDRAFVIERNRLSLRELLDAAATLEIGLMIENLPAGFNSARQLAELLDPLPQLGLHLDIGHANLLTEQNTAPEILERFGTRLRHVHLHDNKGGSADLHLPLGAGNLDLDFHMRQLQAAGYDGTITLEVFTADPHYLAYSRDLLLRAWNQAAWQSAQRSAAKAPPVSHSR